MFLHSKGWTVTSRAKKAKQPRGGYLRPRDMKKIDLQLNPVRGIDELNPDEATNAGLVGMAVDYLTRVMIGDSVEEAFKISLLGAKIIKEEEKARSLISRINGLNKESVICAVKLSGFDVVYRAGRMGYRPVDEIIPDDATIDNIIIMVKRSQQFFKIFGPCVMSGFTFEGGYTDIIVNGDGDYLTPDTLVDFKVSKNNITTAQTLQILIYWRMGLHSIHSEFQNVKYLGIYNPRANILARISVDKISPEVIKIVEYDLIGYR
ncbi:MAG: hypothetical protein J6I76_12505 [Oribacterium sp.]|nr:hypothetical protein [Oribacterium sp.]